MTAKLIRIGGILGRTVDAGKRLSGLLTVPTVLFALAIGPFVWGLHMLNAALAWLVPSGAVLALALWQSRAFLIGRRPVRGGRE